VDAAVVTRVVVAVLSPVELARANAAVVTEGRVGTSGESPGSRNPFVVSGKYDSIA
jgi:hypothetical protein